MDEKEDIINQDEDNGFHSLKTPLNVEDIEGLTAGDLVKVTGDLFTARDAAHKRFLECQDTKFELSSGIIYHCGPLVKELQGDYKDKKWELVAAGPTTSARMSKFVPPLLEKYNIKAIMGKGGLNNSAIKAMIENKCIYISVTGGCASLVAEHINEVKGVCWQELGMPEAVWDLKVKNLPATIAIDLKGQTLYRN